MTIDLQTLKCGECGSNVLQRTGLNQYTCAHCGSVTLVEDNVSERLDRVLDQVKDAAARRLASEQAMRQKQVARMAGVVGLGVCAVVAVVVIGNVLSGNNTGNNGAASALSSVAALADRKIPGDGLKIGEPRQVLVGSGSSAQAKLLVVVRNETGKALDRPAIKAVFYNGDTLLGERSESVPISLLAPGEAAPVLFDLPSGGSGGGAMRQELRSDVPGDATAGSSGSGGGNAIRQELQVQALSAPYRSVEGPRLVFSKVRLVQQGPDSVRLVGRIVNTQDATLSSIEALVTLYDDAGAVIGVGHGYAQANQVRAGQRADMEVRVPRLAGRAAIAAWDYRLSYDTVDTGGASTTVVSPDRVIRTAGAAEVFNSELRIGTEDLLAEDGERFDAGQLELLPLMAGRNNIHQPVYLTELVNRSQDAIVLAPGAVISRFDGSKSDGITRLEGLAYLYPGEHFPVLIEPSDVDRITQTRVEWKPMRRAALPGPRTPLEVRVTGTRAQTGSVLLNFSQRFLYKYVDVEGSVKNPGNGIVRKVNLWVSLRDRNGQLTGFKKVEDLPAIAPGESVPFQASVEQNGRDFASVTTLYQTE